VGFVAMCGALLRIRFDDSLEDNVARVKREYMACPQLASHFDCAKAN